MRKVSAGLMAWLLCATPYGILAGPLGECTEALDPSFAANSCTLTIESGALSGVVLAEALVSRGRAWHALT